MAWLLLGDALLALALLAGTGANAAVLLVFYRRPGLRTLSNRFVMNLVAANLLASCLLLPLELADSLRSRLDAAGTVRHAALCAASEGVASLTCAASVLAVLLIAVDQYCAVVDPLRYHARINTLRSAGMIVGAWALSLLLGALGALDPPPGLWRCCGVAPLAPTSLRVSFVWTYSLLAFALPFLAIALLYARIYRAAHLNSQRARESASVSRSASLRSAAGNGSAAAAAAPGLVRALRTRLSNASAFRPRREEARAARVSALVVAMALLCWLPYVAVLVVRSVAHAPSLPRVADAVSLALLGCGALLSPALFAFRSRRIQRELWRILGAARKRRASFGLPRARTPRKEVAALLAGVQTGRGSFSSGATTSTDEWPQEQRAAATQES